MPDITKAADAAESTTGMVAPAQGSTAPITLKAAAEQTLASVRSGAPGPFTLTPRTLEEAMTFAEMMAGSEMVPESYRGRPADCLVAMCMGAELGVGALQSLQNIAVINGRPTVWGDLVLALVYQSGKLTYCQETWDPQGQVATCEMRRVGFPQPTIRTFSVADAVLAKLTAKDSWQNYPQRMSQMRARSWCARDLFPDVLKGLNIREEILDWTPVPGSPGVEVGMPRRAPADVQKFLGQQQATAPKTAHGVPPKAPPPPRAPAGQHVLTGILESINTKTGASGNKPWTMYLFVVDGGEYSTFSETLARSGKDLVGQPVEISWDAKGQYKNLITLEGGDPRNIGQQ